MSETPGLPPPRPIPLKERAALLFVTYARLDVEDGAFVAVDAEGVRTVIPLGGVACLLLEPGTPSPTPPPPWPLASGPF